MSPSVVKWKLFSSSSFFFNLSCVQTALVSYFLDWVVDFVLIPLQESLVQKHSYTAIFAYSLACGVVAAACCLLVPQSQGNFISPFSLFLSFSPSLALHRKSFSALLPDASLLFPRGDARRIRPECVRFYCIQTCPYKTQREERECFPSSLSLPPLQAVESSTRQA